MVPYLVRSILPFLLTLLVSIFWNGIVLAENFNPTLSNTSPSSNEEVGHTESAQTKANLSQEEIDALIERLDDAEIRQLIIGYSKRKETAEPIIKGFKQSEAGVFSKLLRRSPPNSASLSARIRYVFAGFGLLSEELGKALNRLTDGQGASRLLWMILGILALIAGGIAVEILIRRLTSNARHRIKSAQPKKILEMFKFLAQRTLWDLLYLAVFTFAIYLLFLNFYPTGGPIVQLAINYLPVILIVRLVAIGLKCILSPAASQLRLVPLKDNEAAFLFRGFVLLVIIGPAEATTCWLLLELGVPENVFLLLYNCMILSLFIILAAMIWMSRQRVARAILGESSSSTVDASSFRRKIAKSWHILAIVYALTMILFWVSNLLTEGKDLIFPLMMTFLAFPIGFAIGAAGDKLLRIAFGLEDAFPVKLPATQTLDKRPGPTKEIPLKDPSTSKRRSLARHYPLAHKILTITIIVFIFFWINKLWGVDITIGRAVSKAAISIFMSLLIAYVLWEFAKGIIDRRLRETQPLDEDGLEDIEQGSGGTRAGTLLALLRKTVLAFLIVIVGLIVLSSLDVNIAPLLAGAGIVGLAIGFGAQTLVRDIVSGIFFLIDDAFRVGDYIETAGQKGMVEHISLRSLRLRHPRGMIHTIPFGDMGTITNFSRDYIITKLDFRVRYDTDIDKVRKIIKKIFKQISQNEELASKLLGKIKSQGVRRLEDSAMMMRVKFKTPPGQQFVIQREVFKLMQEAFKKNNIEFAHRNVTVYLPQEGTEPAPVPDKNLTKAAAAAAGLAATQVDEGKKDES